jgi:nickel-dependent lactate racemase
MFAGDYIAAHHEACKFVDYVYGVEIPQEADVVIVSCGGYPKDINVYQMQKTMDNAALAVRKGGVVILLAECEEGSGSKVLEETCRRLKTADAIEAELKEHFVIGANKAYAVTRLMKKAHYILVTGLDKDLAKAMLFTDAVSDVETALAEAEKFVGKDYKVILMPTGSLTVPILK